MAVNCAGILLSISTTFIFFKHVTNFLSVPFLALCMTAQSIYLRYRLGLNVKMGLFVQYGKKRLLKSSPSFISP